VNGKPIYYWVDQHNREIPPDAGYVAVVHSTNITVKDLTLSHNLQGVLFAHTAFSQIKNVIVSDNYIGVHFCGSQRFPNASLGGNVLSQSVISGNLRGVWLDNPSQNNTIFGNAISLNYFSASNFLAALTTLLLEIQSHITLGESILMNAATANTSLIIRYPTIIRELL
jgi:hypothetical protein